jgi:hypothetical protein
MAKKKDHCRKRANNEFALLKAKARAQFDELIAEYEYEESLAGGVYPMPGAEWGGAIAELQKQYSLRRKDVDHPSWPALSVAWKFAEQPVPFLEGRVVRFKKALTRWNQLRASDADISRHHLTLLVQESGFLLLKALLDGDSRFFKKLNDMTAIAFKSRSKQATNRIRFNVLRTAVDLWYQRGKNPTLERLWEVCLKRKIVGAEMLPGAWNKMIDRCHLAFLRGKRRK